MALAEVRSSPAVVEKLGLPIKEGWYVIGNIQINGQSGEANLVFPIEAPLGTAEVYVEATRTGGTWKLESLFVILDATDEQIMVIEPASAESPTERLTARLRPYSQAA